MILKVSGVLTAVALLCACTSQVVEGDGTTGDSAQTGGSGGEPAQAGGAGGHGAGEGGSGNVPQPTPAVAMTRARLDQLWEEYWETHDPSGSSGSTGGGPELDPNDLFLRVSDLGSSCSSPTTELTCGPHWELSIGLPVGYQAVGVYSLDDPLVQQFAYMSETGALHSSDPEDCAWGGGSLGSGTLEIVSIDATEVRFRVEMADSWWESDPSGEYVAPRCP